ncbi:MAG: dTMP kinase [Methylobacteriaceae bacterium]|nr:dTMP kinase [Methylobacteriaceae bacterium]
MPARSRVAAPRGLFITLEGGEGVGKSTQAARLAERLRAAGRVVLTTREPGGSPRAERIRAHLLSGAAERHGRFAEALLFAAARADHLARTIRPALASGAVVICDRFTDSTRVYQGAVGEVASELLSALDRVSTDATRPDLTLLLDVPTAIGLERARARRTARGEAEDRFEREDRAYHERVREAFLAIARAEPARCRVVDASPEPEVVAAAVWRAAASAVRVAR